MSRSKAYRLRFLALQSDAVVPIVIARHLDIVDIKSEVDLR